jgi:multimeric flavodoxin WrbA
MHTGRGRLMNIYHSDSCNKARKRTAFVLGINGSPVKRGRAAKLLNEAMKASAAAGATTKLVHLVDYEKELFTLGHVARPPSLIARLLRDVREADCLILATPVHWFGVSSLMKNFLDHLSTLEANHFLLEGTIAGCIALLEEDGGMKAVLDMVGPLSHMGVMFPPYGMFFRNRNMSRKSERTWMLQDHRLLGTNVVRLAQATKKKDWGY